MEPQEIDALVAAGLAALDLPADEATRKGVAMHAARLAHMSRLVLAIPLADDIESPEVFEP